MSDSEGYSRKNTKITGPHAEGVPGIALALGGGMARGFAHIGVLNVLQRNGIRPSIVAGTSIGAVVGAAYLTGRLKELEEWALSLNRYRILSYLDLRVRSAGLIGGKRLEALLSANFKDIMMEDLPHPFVTVAADLVTGHEVWIKSGSLIQAMRASFALPGVFPPVERNHRLLVDGALVNPVPISVCQSMGARMTIAVDLHADIIGKAAKPGHNYQTVTGFDLFNDSDIDPSAQKRLTNALTKRLFRREENNPSLFGVMVSALNIMQDRMTRSRLAGDPPDIHIKPLIGHIGLLEFEKAAELISEGEAAAMRMLPEIKAAMGVFLPPRSSE
jgi:NTE family protein